MPPRPVLALPQAVSARVQLVRANAPSPAACPRCGAPVAAAALPTLQVHSKLATLVRLIVQYHVPADALQWSNSIGALVANRDGVEVFRGACLLAFLLASLL